MYTAERVRPRDEAPMDIELLEEFLAPPANANLVVSKKIIQRTKVLTCF